MQIKPTLLSSLATIFVTTFTIWTVTDAEKVSPCCIAVSRFMENVPITGYRLQERKLPCIKAVIFQTEKGQFCIDPDQFWVKRKIIEIERSQKKRTPPKSASLHETFSTPQTWTVSSKIEQ